MSSSKTAPTTYEVVQEPEPHPARTAAILKAHPEVRKLFGRTPATALLVPLILVVQFGMAYLVRDQPWWVIVLAAYTLGALVNNTCYVIIHEATHSLIFKGRAANLLTAIGADLVHVIPSAATFTRFHLVHHRHQGEFDLDADLPSHAEAKLVGNSTVMKALWITFFPLMQALRMPRFSKLISFWEPWTVVNALAVFSVDAAVFFLMGPWAFLYVVLSIFFSIGLHPLGGRLIQEHFIISHPQETYSYYGPWNISALNVGYHNEHHDFSAVPWNRLPQVKAAAPEFYDTLVSHRSWTGLLVRFITDPSMSLYSRITRPGGIKRRILTGGVGRVPDSVSSLEQPPVQPAA
ncbi:sphingolipid delta-4 desaturase [Stigmatella aurantiaca]|uniref:Sphingolipid delta-4 desaturase n=1 Tax=Stigmatella aurantiaca TaxID=41 RepID=A0A1H8ASJ7_STIAU|nr:fatty acid desaturase [Stigmatella aurantiaca]SEM72934.1 sphingolipid delta-4 desaturase [Stigmatella aurantiaca]